MWDGGSHDWLVTKNTKNNFWISCENGLNNSDLSDDVFFVFLEEKTLIVGQFFKRIWQCELSQDMLICGFKSFNPQFDAAYGTNWTTVV